MRVWPRVSNRRQLPDRRADESVEERPEPGEVTGCGDPVVARSGHQPPVALDRDGEAAAGEVGAGGRQADRRHFQVTGVAG